MKKEIKKKKLPKEIVKKIVYLAIVFVILTCSLFYSYSLEKFFFFNFEYKEINALDFEMHFVDVGQGTAILARFDNDETMLIDAGPKNAKNKLISYINNIFFKGHKKHFNYIVLTHADGDHSGNMEEVLNSFSCDMIYLPHENNDKVIFQSLLEKINYLKVHHNLQVKLNKAGNVLEIENTKITWLTPVNDNYLDENDFSPIMVFEYLERKIMITGDANSTVGEVEAMEGSILDSLDVDVLSLSHHGSHYGTSSNFLTATLPEHIVISVGKNTYGHPSQNMLLRLLEYDKTYNKDLYNNYKTTLDDGNIIFGVNSNGTLLNYFVFTADMYFFIEWYLVVIIFFTVLCLLTFSNDFKKYFKKLKVKNSSNKAKKRIAERNKKKKTYIKI